MNALEIRENRKRLGLTQKELAKKIGVSLKTISNYEKGEVIPESKKALLHKVLTTIEAGQVEEPASNYQKLKNYDELAEKNLEKIREIEKIIELARINNNNSLINHYNDIIKLLKTQNDLILSAKESHKTELDILDTLE